MKFPRNARMLKGHLDFAPFASVFFCLLIFVLLSGLVYTPGVVIHLPPPSQHLTGIEGKVVPVSVDSVGHLYFENHIIKDADFISGLQRKVREYSPQPVTLLILADTNLPTGRQLEIIQLSRQAGISTNMMGTQAGVYDLHRR